MRNVILASMRTYARRYVAALVAVVIATGFIVAINSLSGAARDGAGEAVAEQYRGANVAAKSVGNITKVSPLRRAALADPDVRAAAVNWKAWTDVTFPDGPQTSSIGSIATAPSLRWQQVSTGRLPTADDEAAISRSRAKTHHVRTGDTLTLDVGERSKKVTVTGIIDDTDGPLRSILYLPEKAFAGLGDIGQPIDEVYAVTGDAAAVAARLDKVAGEAEVLTGAAYQREVRLSATQGIDIFQKLIFVFAAISLFVGALVIANTFTILLAQRSRDLALLRCVGAVRGQIARSVVAEGLVIGGVGTVLGVAFGYLVAVVGAATIGQLSPATPMAGPGLTIGAVAIPVLLGIALTVVASYVPARRAGAQSPLAALQPQDVVEVRTRAGALRLLSAASFLVIGAAGLLVGTQGSLPIGMVGGMLSFVGVLLVTPVLVPAAIRAFGPLARRGGVPGRLAHTNSLRNPRRTAATSTALLVGVTLITSVVVGTASISNKVNTSLDSNHPIDLVASTPQGTLPGGIATELGTVTGVEQAVELRGATARLGKDDVPVLGIDKEALALVHGNAWLRELGANDVVLPAGSDGFPEVAAGDEVTLRVGGQVRELTVSYGSGLGDAALVSQATLTDMGAKTSPAAVWIRAADGANAGDVTSDVTAITRSSDLDLSGGLPERADILKLLNIVLAVTVGLLAIAVLIALIGVGNTLSLSVMERLRENSLLRALGLERSGLRSMLAIEALLMAGVSAVLGIALGSVYAWCGVKALSDGIFESAPSLTVPWAQVALIFVVAAAAGLAACVLPARQAARIAPAAGLVAD